MHTLTTGIHPLIAQALAPFLLTPSASCCTAPDCCYQGQTKASSCRCVDDDMLLCLDCSGSGEGRAEGTTCRACKGMGEVAVMA